MKNVKELVNELNKYVNPSSNSITIEGQNFHNGCYTIALNYLNRNFPSSLILKINNGQWIMGEGAGELNYKQRHILIEFLVNANNDSFKIEN